MRAASTACTVTGTQAVERFDETIGARLPDQHPGFHQGAHTLLQEEGIPLGTRDQ